MSKKAAKGGTAPPPLPQAKPQNRQQVPQAAEPPLELMDPAYPEHPRVKAEALKGPPDNTRLFLERQAPYRTDKLRESCKTYLTEAFRRYCKHPNVYNLGHIVTSLLKKELGDVLREAGKTDVNLDGIIEMAGGLPKPPTKKL